MVKPLYKESLCEVATIQEMDLWGRSYHLIILIIIIIICYHYYYYFLLLFDVQRLFLTRTSYLSKTRLQSAAAQLKPRFAAQNGLPPRERSLLTPLFFFFGVGGGGG